MYNFNYSRIQILFVYIRELSNIQRTDVDGNIWLEYIISAYMRRTQAFSSPTFLHNIYFFWSVGIENISKWKEKIHTLLPKSNRLSVASFVAFLFQFAKRIAHLLVQINRSIVGWLVSSFVCLFVAISQVQFML